MKNKNSNIRILTRSNDIRKEIVRIMSPGCKRRVAISAIVGDGARAFIPRPLGVQIICWPKAGGTNPKELRRLKQAGAKVEFVDSLHMKVYWARGRNAIITSANLSTNALGARNLKEIAVVLPYNAVDVEDIISSLKRRRYNKVDMDKLEEAHRKLSVRMRPRTPREDKTAFLEWYVQPARPMWKLGWWADYGSLAKRSVDTLQSDYGKKTAADWVSCRKHDYKEADWVLAFRLTKRGATSLQWMYVDRVVRVSSRDKRAYFADYPYQAIQAYTARHYPPAPFRATREFRKAFQQASLDYGVEKIMNMRTATSPPKLLKMIADRLK